jgi:uncharacterized protein YbjT (DUF2867 family)
MPDTLPWCPLSCSGKPVHSQPCSCPCMPNWQVDYDGQVAQFEAARRTGRPVHVVLISSAGGCDPKHFLNYIGQGDILNWKRKAEQHLVASGLPYTILHPNRECAGHPCLWEQPHVAPASLPPPEAASQLQPLCRTTCVCDIAAWAPLCLDGWFTLVCNDV